MFTYLILFSIIATINAANISDFEGNCHILHTSGYGYNAFFQIPKTSWRNDGSIHIKFSIIAPSNAHILLSPKNAPSDKDVVYEIVLGAGKNTFSTIRKLRTTIRVSVNTAGILDENDLRVFWIDLAEGIIDVGRDDEIKPLVRLVDPEPLQVNFMSFGAWIDVTATWIYDCKNVTKAVKIKEEKTLNILRRFTVDFLSDYDTFRMPHNAGEETHLINTEVLINYINLDLQKLRLETNVDFHFAWNDSRLMWKPNFYGDIKTIQLNYYNIWRPKFFLFNPTRGFNIGKVNKIKVQNSGLMQWSVRQKIVTNCNHTDVSSWPWDSHKCEIRLGFYPYPMPMNFALSKTNQIPKPKVVGNEWKVDEILIVLENSTILDNPVSNTSNVLVIYASLLRQPSPLILIFVLPIICAVVVTHFSFLLPPDCSARLYFHFISLIIFTIYLLSCGSTIPAKNLQTPLIVVLCSHLLLLATFHTIVTAFIMNIIKFNEENAPPLSIRKLLGNKGVRNIFLLPEQGLYNELEQNANDDSKKFQNIWYTLAVILDRIIFAISSVIIACTCVIVFAK